MLRKKLQDTSWNMLSLFAHSKLTCLGNREQSFASNNCPTWYGDFGVYPFAITYVISLQNKALS